MTVKRRPNSGGYAQREGAPKRKMSREDKLRDQLERATALMAQSPDPHLARRIREIQDELLRFGG